jgi:predicted RNA-binding protein with PUA-like domain
LGTAEGEGQGWRRVDGVRNFQARKNMKAMKLGDLGFFYHSGESKAIVGIVEVIRLAHPDSTAKEGNWECVDIRAVRDVPKPVTLEQCKTDKRLKRMVLVNNSRLSVQPVTADEWDIVCEIGGVV